MESYGVERCRTTNLFPLDGPSLHTPSHSVAPTSASFAILCECPCFTPACSSPHLSPLPVGVFSSASFSPPSPSIRRRLHERILRYLSPFFRLALPFTSLDFTAPSSACALYPLRTYIAARALYQLTPLLHCAIST